MSGSGGASYNVNELGIVGFLPPITEDEELVASPSSSDSSLSSTFSDLSSPLAGIAEEGDESDGDNNTDEEGAGYSFVPITDASGREGVQLVHVGHATGSSRQIGGAEAGGNHNSLSSSSSLFEDTDSDDGSNSAIDNMNIRAAMLGVIEKSYRHSFFTDLWYENRGTFYSWSNEKLAFYNHQITQDITILSVLRSQSYDTDTSMREYKRHLQAHSSLEFLPEYNTLGGSGDNDLGRSDELAIDVVDMNSAVENNPLVLASVFGLLSSMLLLDEFFT